MNNKKRAENLDFFFHILIIVLVLASVFLLILEYTVELDSSTELIIEKFDYFIIFIFSIDLILEYRKIRNIKKFFKRCWLDILAIIPINGFFRILKFSRVIRPFIEAKRITYETEKIIKLREVIHFKHLKGKNNAKHKNTKN